MLGALLAEGLAHQQAGQLDRAEELYRKVLAIDGENPDALHLSAMAAHAHGEFQKAQRLLDRALARKPNEPAFLANRGVIAESLGQLEEAEGYYRQALALNPRHVVARNNLGNLHRAAGRRDQARDCYQAALAERSDFAPAWNNLGTIYADDQEFDLAIDCYRRALAVDSQFADAHKNLAHALAEQGSWEKARGALSQVNVTGSGGAAVRIRRALVLPVIAPSVAAIEECRRRLGEELDRFLKEEAHCDDDPFADPIAQTLGPAFYLAYHGQNDIELQRKIAAVHQRAFPSLSYTAPHCRRRRQRQRPVRVGVISRFLQQHSVGHHYAGLMRAFPRNDARYVALRFAGRQDETSARVAAAADEVVSLSDRLDQARKQIAACELDVLLYTDIGMDPWTYFLAFARLAPVQCVTLGHPVTTGISTIDYFLSCERIEPPGAQAHYSERLICFRDVPHFFTRPKAVARKNRSDYPLAADARWYVCQQTLFKFHPEFDSVLGHLLRRDQKALVVLFQGQQPQWARLLAERFCRSIPDVASRIVFLPRLGFDDYLGLISLADVLIDTTHFSAGTTMFQSLALGLPLVTLPGAFARGRGAYAAYRKMSTFDCVATSEADFIERAVRLANDRSAWEAIHTALLDQSACLFENYAAATEMEQFFVEAADRAASLGD